MTLSECLEKNSEMQFDVRSPLVDTKLSQSLFFLLFLLRHLRHVIITRNKLSHAYATSVSFFRFALVPTEFREQRNKFGFLSVDA
jgi:hypothetical protein